MFKLLISIFSMNAIGLSNYCNYWKMLNKMGSMARLTCSFGMFSFPLRISFISSYWELHFSKRLISNYPKLTIKAIQISVEHFDIHILFPCLGYRNEETGLEMERSSLISHPHYFQFSSFPLTANRHLHSW